MPKGYKKNGEPNGQPTRFKSGKEAQEAGRKGGKRSVEVRREKAEVRKQNRSLAEMLSVFVNAKAPIDPRKPRELMEKMGVDEEVTVLAMGCLNLAQRVAQGDLKALELYNRLTESQKIDITSGGKEIHSEPLQVHFVTNSKDYHDVLAEIEKRSKEEEG